MGLEPDIIRIVSTPYCTSTAGDNDEHMQDMWDAFSDTCLQEITVYGHHWGGYNWKCAIPANTLMPSSVALSKNALPFVNDTLTDIWSGVAKFSNYVFMRVDHNIDQNCFLMYKLIDASNLNEEIAYSSYCLSLRKSYRSVVPSFVHLRTVKKMARKNIIEKNLVSVRRKSL